VRRVIYEFETDAEGWVAQDHRDSRAITQVARAGGIGFHGEHSLALKLDLEDEGELKCNGKISGEGKCRGEVFVDFANHPIPGIGKSIDMTEAIVEVRIFVPEAAVGDRDVPNGVQLFVQDEDFNSYYGNWKNLSPGWMRLRLRPRANWRKWPEFGHVDANINIEKIRVVGVKIGVGVGGDKQFKGMMYLDSVVIDLPK